MTKLISAKNSINEDTIQITDFLSEIMNDISNEYEIFSHIIIENVFTAITTNRKNSRRSYTFGKCVPLKFRNGSDTILHRGHNFKMPEVFVDGKEILYILSFFNPRFFNLTFHEKLRVIFHEMYHIGENFDGDIRRFGKSGSAHGSSRKKFDSLFEAQRLDYARKIYNSPEADILAMNMNDLQNSFSAIEFSRIKIPKPYLID